jgi:hypothetical protein
VARQQVEHGHEAALTASEAAMMAAGLVAEGLDRAADETQRVVEAVGELRRDDVLPQRLLGPFDPLTEPEDDPPGEPSPAAR